MAENDTSATFDDIVEGNQIDQTIIDEAKDEIVEQIAEEFSYQENILDNDVNNNDDVDNYVNPSNSKLDSSNNEVDDDDDSRKLFVGGLSWETTEEDLKMYFETWGKVTHCLIKLDKMTGNSRGFGFVTMESEDVCRRVLEVSEHRLKNKKIDPKPAKPTKEPSKKIFVGGLSPDVKEEQIKEYFSQFGVVESIDLPFDTPKGKRKPYIFLSFSTEDAAKQAIVNEKQNVLGSKCDVRMAVPKDQVNKTKMAAWGPYGSGMYPPGSEYYNYGVPYSFDPNASYYPGFFKGVPYGYSYPMPPQPYVVPPRAPIAGGKMTQRGRGTGGYHPYVRQ